MAPSGATWRHFFGANSAKWRQPLAPIGEINGIAIFRMRKSGTNRQLALIAPLGAIYLAPKFRCFGANWRQLAPFGANFSAIWRHVAPRGATWRHLIGDIFSVSIIYQLAPIGANWRQLAPFGAIWRHVKNGAKWRQ